MKHTAGILVVLALAPLAPADDWPCWRGPDRNGISRETGWKADWGEKGPPVSWKASVGTGFSSFVVAGDRVLTMGHADGKDTVWCLDANSGKPAWSHSYPSELGDRYFEGGPTSTPTVDGDRVYALSRWGDLFCLDLSTGKVRWSKNVQKETEAPIPGWGFSSSPLVHEDLLVLNVGEAGLAVDKHTGKIAWSSGRSEAGYSTPLPFQHKGEWYAWLGTGNAYVAVHIKTGKVLWEHRWITRYGVNATDPLPAGEHVFISTGYNKGATLLHVADGELKTLWRTKEMRNQMNPSVLIDGYVYGVDGDTTEDAVLKCVEMKTGKPRWSREGVGSGALVAADGKLIVLSASGELLIGKASPEGFAPTTRAQVLSGKCWTAPVLANGRIYCRNADGDVVCLDVRERK